MATASDGTYCNENSFACGDNAECHADDHVYCTPENTHDSSCPDPCRHDNECPHGKSNLAGETCSICEGSFSGGIEADPRVVFTYDNRKSTCSSVLFLHDDGNHEIVCSCKGSYFWTIRSSTVPNLREVNNV